ncbi:MAG: BatD family protein, partial [Myxococcales bacterium]|nr:BatD family protein [Myxococcales bacterium]
VTTDTGAAPRLDPPPGVRIVGTGQSHRVQIFGGVAQQHTTWTYRIVADHEGTVRLGPFRVGPDSTPELVLEVQGAPVTGPTTGRAAPAQPGAFAGTDRAYARLWLGDTTPVVGQAIPLTVSAFLRGDTGGTIEGAPQLDAPDFVVEGLDEQPTRKEVDVDGVPYTRFTWTASLTPVRQGDFRIAATLPATLQWVERGPSRRRSLLDEMLDDPFFSGSFASSMLRGVPGGLGEPQLQSAHVELDASAKLAVTSPPVAGRPTSFRGTVGTFAARLEPTPRDARVGEPIELTFVLEGEGNLDAMDEPGWDGGARWDAYPPEKRVEATNRSRTKGSATYRQLVVPRDAGPLDLPALEVSWFDPTAGAYRTSLLKPDPIEVVGAPAVAAVAPVQPAAPSEPRRLPWSARRGVLGVVPAVWVLVLLAWAVRDRSAGWIVAASGAVGRRLRLSTLRRRLVRAASRQDVEGALRTGVTLVEAAGADPARPGVRAFVQEADRALYGRLSPEPDALADLVRGLLDDLEPRRTP